MGGFLHLSMPDATPPPPGISRSVSALARGLVAAARNWALYPPDHPAVRSAVARLEAALATASTGQPLSLGITPDTLLIAGTPAGSDGPIAEAAAWLHQHDVLHITFADRVPLTALQSLLALMAEDIAAVRGRGGPARAWLALGEDSISIEQIDFAGLFRDREVQPLEDIPHRKDDVWRAIVRSVTDRRKVLDEAVQRRLLEIAGDTGAISELAGDVIAPNCSADGSPMLTSQAGAVAAAYRQLVDIVDVMDPGRRAEVMQNLTVATANLDPRVILHLLSAPNDGGPAGTGSSAAEIRNGIAAGMDDFRVAQLLAATLAIDGQASGRLAGVFDTIAPDEPRKRRVLTLARTLLTETSFGQTDQFQTLWSSMEELLLTYNERPFVSAQYKTGLDQVSARAEAMAADLPDDVAALIDTLGQDNVRRLSVTLLVDLLTLERDPARAPALANDVAALGEDLLMAGDYSSARAVTRALAERAAADGVTKAACRIALDGLVEGAAFHEAVEFFGEMPPDDAACFTDICLAIGPPATAALRVLLEAEEDTSGRERARAVIQKYGGRAASRLAPLASSDRWYVRRNAADVLGDLGSAEAVPYLQPLLRAGDSRVIQSAVRALSRIEDAAAGRAVHTVLRAAAGEHRHAVIAALVAERDPRVIPVLLRILSESNPFGTDHEIVLDTLGAVGEVGRDSAVAEVAQVMRRKRWLAPGKSRALKQASIAALQRIGTPAATQAIAEAAANGDRLLRRLARAAGSK